MGGMEASGPPVLGIRWFLGVRKRCHFSRACQDGQLQDPPCRFLLWVHAANTEVCGHRGHLCRHLVQCPRGQLQASCRIHARPALSGLR